MRVITGTARGRKLKEPKNMDVRPTTDMVKEAIFNIIQSDIEGRRALDLFAGTGQLGIEALSRGAAEVVFVDENTVSAKLVRENLEHCKFDARVVQTEALLYLERCEKFDLVFLDPPYDTGLLEKALQKCVKVDILNEGGIIVCESKKEKVLPEVKEPYYLISERNYGKIKISVYGKRVS